MAKGLAAIVSPAGGLAELVQDERNGLIVQSDEANVWSQALLQLLTDPEKTLAMGEASRNIVVERMQWKTVALQWEASFLKLCGAQKCK
jgi:glycosyltransferase involved in cell wall biosynthesis